MQFVQKKGFQCVSVESLLTVVDLAGISRLLSISATFPI